MKTPKFLKPSKKKIIIFVALLAIAFIGINFFTKPKQTPLQFGTVKKQDIRSVVSSSGTLAGKNSVSLKFKSGGKLAYLNVKTGDQVFAGQVIAGLDTQDLNISLQQAQNTARDKQATVDKILDDIHLFQYGNGGFGNVNSQNETETQRQLRTTAEVSRDNAFDNVKAAERAFQDSVIISPISGIVTQTSLIPGQTVGGSDIIAQVVDTSEILFDTEIDEADFSKIIKDLPAEITLDAFPNQTFTGTVDQITPQVQTTSSGATVISAKIKLKDPKIIFVNGLSGQASIIISKAKNTLTIPLEALRDDETVVVEEGKTLVSKKVTIGIESDTDIEIKEGLKENDKILLNPPTNITQLNRNAGNNPLGGFFRFLGGNSSRPGANRNR